MGLFQVRVRQYVAQLVKPVKKATLKGLSVLLVSTVSGLWNSLHRVVHVKLD